MKINKNKMRTIPVKFLFYSIMFLIFTSSAIKQIDAFYEGDLRYFYGFSHLISNLSLNFFVLGFVLCLLFLLFSAKRVNSFIKPSASVSVFVGFKILALAVLLMYGQSEPSVFISLSFIIVLILFISAWQSSYRNFVEEFSKSVFYFSIFFVSINFWEYFTNYESTVWGMRMYGVTNHPNFLGGYAMIMFSFSMVYVFSKNRTIALAALITSFSLFMLILMSGSRSSLLGVFVAAIVFSIKAKFVKEMMVVICSAVILLILLAVLDLGGVSEYLGFERLLMTDNTRDYVTFELIQVFSNNILFGNPVSIESTSNSYLSAAARYGIFGVILLVISYVSSIMFFSKNINFKSPYIPASYSAVVYSLIPYSLFEGVLVENFSFALVVFIVCLSVSSNRFFMKK